jgi:SAM-dependent methyltransferase
MNNLTLWQKLSPKYLYLKRKKILPFFLNLIISPVRNIKYFSHLNKYNSIKYQKELWASELMKSEVSDFNCNYRFDSPLCQHESLGDYEKVKTEYLYPNITGKKVLEIGCLGGKWSQYFFKKNAASVILVDLDERVEDFLHNKFPNETFQYYKTKGYELYGIPNDSVDFIFSIDCLVRCPKKNIKMYFEEFGRVLSKNGSVFLHLPCKESKLSVELGFVNLSKKEIETACNNNDWNHFELDFDTIEHGVLLKVNLK